MKITPKEFDLLAAYIFKISGITLDKGKRYLIENRLKPLLGEYGFVTYLELYRQSQNDRNNTLKRDIIDAISTNETFFFRDTKPFDLLRNKIIPELIDHRQNQGFRKIPLRIWSAACSTGQEVYTIGMTLHEMLPNINDFDISILGTDISAQAIQRASYGKYNHFEMQRGLPEPYRQKYFTRQGDDWRIKDKVRSLAQFQQLNLLRPFTDQIHGFDIVFCRNVAIYFSPADKKQLFTNIGKVMVQDGALLVGGSETLTNITSIFQSQQYLRTIFYTLRPGQNGSPPKKAPRPTPAWTEPKKAGPHPAIAPKPKVISSSASTPRAQPTAQRQITKTVSPAVKKSQKTTPSPNKKDQTSLLATLASKQQKNEKHIANPVKEKMKPTKSLLAIITEKKKKT